MKQETVKHFADGATISAVGTGASSYFGWFSFINDNAPGIGVLLSLIFGVIGIVFYYMTWKKATLADDNKKELSEHSVKLDSHIKETRKEFKEINNGVKSILDRLEGKK